MSNSKKKSWLEIPRPGIFIINKKSGEENEDDYLIDKESVILEIVEPTTIQPPSKSKVGVFRICPLVLAAIMVAICMVLGLYCVFQFVRFQKVVDDGPPIGPVEPLGSTAEVRHEVADQFKSYINENVDPCEDFWTYSCGNWSTLHNPINITDHTIDALGDMSKGDTKVIQRILENLKNPDGAAQKAQNLYLSCINKKLAVTTTTTTTVAPTFNLDVPILSDYYDEYDKIFEDSTDSGVEDEDEYPNCGETDEEYEDDDEADEWLEISPEIRKYLQPYTDIKDSVDRYNSLTLSCAALTQQLFPDVTARLFVTATFPFEKASKIQFILKEISEMYKKQISRISWIDEETKVTLKHNISNTKVLLGYPQNVMNIEEEIFKYSDVHISSEGESYYSNVDKLPVSSGINIEEVPSANAFYSSFNDQIYIPAGIAQKPFFDLTYPDIINYAKFASVLSHEYTHAFERYINGKGLDSSNFDQDDDDGVSSAAVKLNFKLRNQCIQDQYTLFKLPHSSVKLNGENTWTENLADILGLQLAYLIYAEKYKENYLPLPGLDKFSQDQIFFIAMAQTNCRSYTDNEARELFLNDLYFDPHSPNSIRLLGEMVNNDEFSQAFNCPLGSRYNPLKKCRYFE